MPSLILLGQILETRMILLREQRVERAIAQTAVPVWTRLQTVKLLPKLNHPKLTPLLRLETNHPLKHEIWLDRSMKRLFRPNTFHTLGDHLQLLLLASLHLLTDSNKMRKHGEFNHQHSHRRRVLLSRRIALRPEYPKRSTLLPSLPIGLIRECLNRTRLPLSRLIVLLPECPK